MTDTYQGECLCGQVKYEITDPVGLGICHCTRCQRWTSSGMAVVVTPIDNYRVLQGEDKIKSYLTPGFAASRNFCGECGSSLFDDLGENYAVCAGGLGNDFPLDVTFHLEVGSKARWEIIPDDGATQSQ